MALEFDVTLPSGVEIPNAYGYIAAISLDAYAGGVGSGSLVVNVHPGLKDWQKPPALQVPVVLGEKNPEGLDMPTLAELQAVPEFAQGMALIVGVLYEVLRQRHPLFREAKDV